MPVNLTREMNIMAIAQGQQRFVFLYDDAEESLAALFDAFNRFTENPEIGLGASSVLNLKQRAMEVKEADSRVYRIG